MRRPFDWEDAGARLGSELDHRHAIVVLGDDPVATAEVALGIGRAQAGRRRVAVCDLLGEAPPIQALVTGDDLHGIVDSFTYGVSLNRIAREAPGTPGMFIMPTGTEPVDAQEIFPNTRWKRLASGFREMGALLILAARADAPAVEALVAQLDGAVLVGEVVPTHLPVAAVISAIRQPAAVHTAEPALVDVPVDFTAIDPESGRRGRLGQVLKGATAIVLITALGVWFAMRPFDSSFQRPSRPPQDPQPADSVLPVGGNASAGGAGTTAGDSIAEVPAVANPADSARATAWAVELLATNTAAGAAARVREEGDDLPAGTYAAAVVDGAEWYKVMAGAYPTRALADTLLQLLRREGELDERSGSVVRLPYAFLVHSEVQDSSVQGLLNAYRDLGQPVYALRQDDGTMKVYAGAFESPEQAALLVGSLRAAGITPTLVYRTGRIF
jgi:hypothetical protein